MGYIYLVYGTLNSKKFEVQVNKIECTKTGKLISLKENLANRKRLNVKELDIIVSNEDYQNLTAFVFTDNLTSAKIFSNEIKNLLFNKIVNIKNEVVKVYCSTNKFILYNNTNI